MHIVFDALIDVIPVWLGFVPFEHADEPVSVFAALVLALCEGIARLIRVLYWGSAAVIMLAPLDAATLGGAFFYCPSLDSSSSSTGTPK